MSNVEQWQTMTKKGFKRKSEIVIIEMPSKRTLSETSESMEFATPIWSSTFSEDKLEDSLSKSSPEEEKLLTVLQRTKIVPNHLLIVVRH